MHPPIRGASSPSSIMRTFSDRCWLKLITRRSWGYFLLTFCLVFVWHVWFVPLRWEYWFVDFKLSLSKPTQVRTDDGHSSSEICLHGQIWEQTYQILPLSHAHLLHYGPKPAFKLQQFVCIFPCWMKWKSLITTLTKRCITVIVTFQSWRRKPSSRWRASSIPDSSLKEVKLMSIWTLTSPQPLTSSLKSSAVRSSRAFFGSTSSKPFLIAYTHTHTHTWTHVWTNWFQHEIW